MRQLYLLWVPRAALACAVILTTASAATADPKPPEKKAGTEAARPRLQFRIAANPETDAPAIKAAGEYFAAARTDPARKAKLKQLAAEGLPPEPLKPSEAGTPGYSWLEIGPPQLRHLLLDGASEKDTPPLSEGETELRKDRWQAVSAARDKGEPVLIPTGWSDMKYFRRLIWSRACPGGRRPGDEAPGKRFEYFMLVRDLEPGKAITDKHLVLARAVTTDNESYVEIKLNKEGGQLMHELTSRNEDKILAVAVDGAIVSAPTIRGPIDAEGRILGLFSRQQVEDIAAKLNARKPR